MADYDVCRIKVSINNIIEMKLVDGRSNWSQNIFNNVFWNDTKVIYNLS